MRLVLPAVPASYVPIFLAMVMLTLVGCGEPRQVGDIYVQGDVASYNYYAEFREKQSNGKERIYLLADPKSVKAFAAGAKELPLSKTMIAVGPNKETIMIEQVKDPAASMILIRRLLATFNAKNQASVKIP
jgi:hypothetical protein